MSSADINHTEEMERAYWEAWMACKEINSAIRSLSFEDFANWIDSIKSFRLSEKRLGYGDFANFEPRLDGQEF